MLSYKEVLGLEELNKIGRAQEIDHEKNVKLRK